MLLLRAFLPQTGLLLPSAAFLVLAVPLFRCSGGRAKGYSLCMLFGALAGAMILWTTQTALRQVQTQYAGRTVLLTAEVQSARASYSSGVVRAVLYVEEADGVGTGFRVECSNLPVCSAGQRIRGCFALEVPDETRRLDLYADAVALTAEYQAGFARAGASGSFRARTGRLQQKLSRSLRGLLDEDTGGVLAAMVVGDRNVLPSELSRAYRAAGLSHVLVVSGMHVSILCSGIFGALPFGGKRRERSYRSRRLQAVLGAGLALLLVGITGFTPSVLRAASAVWIGALGVLVYGPPDALTSLAAAGFLMSVGNAYAVCDVGFELSFAAVLGTLTGAEAARQRRAAYRDRRMKKKKKPPCFWQKLLRSVADTLCETVCISACASAATFPVLVLRGMSVSLYSLLSGVAALWLVEPMLLLGVGAALTGLLQPLWPLYYVFSFGAGLLASWLNAWVRMVAQWSGAQLYFDTAYAALICLLLIALCALAVHWKVRLKLAVPAVLLSAALAIGVGNALNRDVIHVELVGSSGTPAVVVVQNNRAIVLLRGGSATQSAVETALARRGADKAELLVDLRLEPEAAVTLPAARTLRAAQQEPLTTVWAECGEITVELLRTRNGCAVRLHLAGQTFVALSGTVDLAKPVQADWLLASPANPAAFRWDGMLALSDRYRWMDAETPAGQRLDLRPAGGVRVWG